MSAAEPFLPGARDIDVSIRELASRHRQGYCLEQPFYSSPLLFDVDLRRIFEREWILVDHVSRIPARGDYFLFEIGAESIIIVQCGQGEVKAFFNVCRHRGSRICLEKEGHNKLFTCPYHAWSYRLDGSLLGKRLMPGDFDPAQFHLHECEVRVFQGFIFIALNEADSPDFEVLTQESLPFITPYDFPNAKIAARRQYPTKANWKLVVENFYECYHCAPAHREYCSVHSPEQIEAFGAGPGSGTTEATERFRPVVEAWEARSKALGYPVHSVVDGVNSRLQRSFSRYPLGGGDAVSDARGGKSACKLRMGQFREKPDGGNTALAFNPWSLFSASNDYATMFRFTPRSELSTDVELVWLVAADAVEGRDYDVPELTWLWDVTTRQDKKIAEDNQSGVLSRRYVPGPYSSLEGATDRVIRWYLHRLMS